MTFKPNDAENEYKKDKLLKKSDVKMLQDWLEKQPHLPKATEFQLILFLQSCYYRIEAAKTAIDNFFTVRTLCPDLFSTPSVEQLKHSLSVGSINVLPEKTPEGYTAVLMKLLDTNPDHYHCVNQINLLDLTMMVNLYQNGTCKGILALFDMKGLTFGHITRFNLVAIKKHLFYVQEAVPVRIKGLHFINVVSFADTLLSMVKPFMKKELVEMINLHSESMDTLYKFVPKECLPKDYGGKAPPLPELHEANTKNLLENLDLFRWQDSQKVDETKRQDGLVLNLAPKLPIPTTYHDLLKIITAQGHFIINSIIVVKMPHFRLETNVSQDKIPADLPKKLCQVLAQSLGKPINYCVATVIGGVNMSFGGTNEPAAQATLMSIGALGVDQNKKHAKALYDVISKELGVPKDRMYIHFINAPSSDVGFNGTTFHDILG